MQALIDADTQRERDRLAVAGTKRQAGRNREAVEADTQACS
jgi:hypothetical protein